MGESRIDFAGMNEGSNPFSSTIFHAGLVIWRWHRSYKPNQESSILSPRTMAV